MSIPAVLVLCPWAELGACGPCTVPGVLLTYGAFSMQNGFLRNKSFLNGLKNFYQGIWYYKYLKTLKFFSFLAVKTTQLLAHCSPRAIEYVLKQIVWGVYITFYGSEQKILFSLELVQNPKLQLLISWLMGSYVIYIS